MRVERGWRCRLDPVVPGFQCHHGDAVPELWSAMLASASSGVLAGTSAGRRPLEIHLKAVRSEVEKTIEPSGQAPAGSPPFTSRAKKVLELSLREALQLGHNYIGTEHMLLGLIREGEGVATQVLKTLGADLPRVRQQVIALLAGQPSPEAAEAAGVSFEAALEQQPNGQRR